MFWFAWLACSGAPPAPTAAEVASPARAAPTDVLVLLWDTARADRMSLYGHSRQTTPNLERRAASGRVYERAISPGMWTVPSHASLFTGLYPTSHGASARWIWLDGHHLTLAERLGEAGYLTWLWTSNPYLSAASNLVQGFQERHATWEGPSAAEAEALTRSKLLPGDASMELGPAFPKDRPGGWPEHLTAGKDAAPLAAEAYAERLDQLAPGQRLFAFVNLLEAHHPRLPSAAARAALLEPALAERALVTDGSLFALMAAMEGRRRYSPEEIEALLAVYDAALWDLDSATEGFFRALEDRGRLESTLVVLVADHGEHFGEQGRFDHRWSLYEPLVHVPMVVWWPGALPPGRVSAPVSTLDLFATVLDAAGLTPPAELPSRSLRDPTPRPVFAELDEVMPRLPVIRKAFPDLDPDRWSRRYQAWYEAPYKLLRSSDGQHQLFHLGSDPGETRSLVSTEGERAKALNERAKAFVLRLPVPDPALRTPEDSPKNALAGGGVREQLEALGYVTGEEEP